MSTITEKNETSPTTVLLPVPFKLELRKAARRAQRTQSQFLVRLLRIGFEEYTNGRQTETDDVFATLDFAQEEVSEIT
jgi:hypothetical protein